MPDGSSTAGQVADVSDMAAEGAGSPPVTPNPQQEGVVRHDHIPGQLHPHVKWHTDVLVDGHDVYRGYVRDVSLKGAELFLSHNLQHSQFVKLHIHVPPLQDSILPRILEMTARVLSPVYDSRAEYFRSSIVFLQFTFESDKTYLRTRVE
ncbi:MAG: PilZ domain-containing protein [Gallionella sp.]|jgi:hypothetical protein